MRVVAWKDADTILIMGHGLTVPEETEIAEGVSVSREIPNLVGKDLANESIADRAAIQSMHDIATFSLVIKNEEGGKALASKGWNRLWDFHLLSIASRSPCFILYADCKGKDGRAYSVPNRNLLIQPLADVREMTPASLQWARENEPRFRDLISNPQFAAAMRYFGNAHYLFDLDQRVMLLWAGIEGLLKVDAEHSRRLALYSALMCAGDLEAKFARFEMVKRAYSLRSRVVHGAKPDPEKVKKGYAEATELLADLLAKCVELGRVPSRDELDRAALGGSL
jgi:hypothetical protein